MTKEEKKEYDKQHYLDNREKKRQRYIDNKEHYKEYQKQRYIDNKEKKRQYYLDNKEQKKQYRLDNKEKIKEQKKQYRLDNKEKINEQSKQYRLDNKEEKRRYETERYHSDPLYKFKRVCRSRTYQAFKTKSWSKNGSTEKLLGCDYKTAMNHIEKQFELWMNWENHGEWHIDHDTPLASANTIEEMTPLFHYTNLVPLLAEDNIRKGDKILN